MMLVITCKTIKWMISYSIIIRKIDPSERCFILKFNIGLIILVLHLSSNYLLVLLTKIGVKDAVIRILTKPHFFNVSTEAIKHLNCGLRTELRTAICIPLTNF
jgi:hypothetical protein